MASTSKDNILRTRSSIDLKGGFRIQQEGQFVNGHLHNLSVDTFEAMVEAFDSYYPGEIVRAITGESGPFYAATLNFGGLRLHVYSVRLTPENAPEHYADEGADDFTPIES